MHGEEDVALLMQMKEVGESLLDKMCAEGATRRMGFHIPPFNSVDHLHLHLQELPYVSTFRSKKYPTSHAKSPNKSKGFAWFVTIDQAITILARGGKVGLFSC